MKIREALISNSSSTSFMVFHNVIDIYSLIEQYAVNNFPKNRYYIYGQEFGEGIDFFPMTKVMFRLIKDHISKNGEWKWSIRDVHLMKSSSLFSKQELANSILNVPEKFNIDIVDVDYHATQKIDDFKERYLNK